MPVPEALVETQLEAQAVQMDHESSQQSISLEGPSQLAAPGKNPTEQAESQIYKYTHSDGSEFSGTLAEARKICTVIGKMSIENAQATLQDADLARRVAQRGRERREAEAAKITEAKKKDVRQAETPDPKLEKAPTEPAVRETEVFANKIIEPRVDQINKFAASELAVPDLHALHLQHAEAARAAQDNAAEFEGASTIHIEKAKPTDKQKTAPTIGYRQASTEVAGAETPHIVEDRVPVSNEYIIHQRDESPSELPLSIPKGKAMPEIATTKTFEGSKINELATIYYPLNADEDPLAIDGSEAARFKLGDEAAAFHNTFGAHQFVQENLVETVETEAHPLAAIPELPAPVAEIEAAMTELTGVIEGSEDTVTDEPKKIDEILQRIITLPTKFEAADSEEAEELEQELEVLFVELFKEAGIPYTSELIESFVKLTKAHYLEELLAITKDTDENQNQPTEIGTREFLRKLQHGLSTMRQTVVNFYEIGKSIMRLYEYSFEPTSFNFRVI